jgi:hypothetical protein
MFYAEEIYTTFKWGAAPDPDWRRAHKGHIVGIQLAGSIGRHTTYQMSNGKQQRKPYYVPYDPKTEAQLSLRSKFADAVAWAKGLSEEEKQYYKDKVRRRWKLKGWPFSAYSNRSWLNFAISDYMHDVDPFGG